MQLLLDMGVSRLLIPRLIALGYPSVHLVDEGLSRLPDAEILEKARAEGRVVITHDLDFAELTAASRERLPSVILLRLRNMRPEMVLLHLQKALARCAAALEAGAIVSVSENLLRVRELPVRPRR